MAASVVAVSLPHLASAFWPFTTNAGAATNSIVPDSSTPALKAATNSDPNPNKGIGETIATSGGKALLAYAGPSGTIADVATSTVSDTISVYVVRPGDSLGIIAEMFNVSVNTIIWANDLKNAKDVRPGDTLIILPISGVEHKIVKGDTLKSIAKKYDADVDEIAQYNGLDVSKPLVVGTNIMIPGGEISTPSAGTKTTNIYSGGTSVVVSGYFSNPIQGGTLTQGLHGGNAVDIGAARGTPVRAAAAGTIIIARNNGAWNGGYGNYVVITHSNGTQTLYSHLSSSIVSARQEVSKGQVIGYVGTTGRTTGPHLHFEIRGATNPFRNCSVGKSCFSQ